VSSSLTSDPIQTPPAGRVGLRDVLGMYPNVREERLRHLSKWGLIQPVQHDAATEYSFRDVGVIKQVSAELDAGRSFRAIVRAQLAAQQGQLSLDFQPSAPRTEPARVIALPRPPRRAALPGRDAAAPADGPARRRAAEYFLEGFSLDEDEHNPEGQEGALVAYRRALTLDPDLIPALVNLGNIHYAREARVEAQALYERAVALQADCFEAHFNLGHVHHDLGRYTHARACYVAAIAIEPTYPEAHFYLAVVLEKQGLSADARRHWRAYRDMAPDGEWVELAREFSE